MPSRSEVAKLGDSINQRRDKLHVPQQYYGSATDHCGLCLLRRSRSYKSSERDDRCPLHGSECIILGARYLLGQELSLWGFLCIKQPYLLILPVYKSGHVTKRPVKIQQSGLSINTGQNSDTTKHNALIHLLVSTHASSRINVKIGDKHDFCVWI